MTLISIISSFIFVLTLFLLIGPIFIILEIFKKRNKTVPWTGMDTFMTVTAICLFVLGIISLVFYPTKETRDKLFYMIKPTCQEETIKCLERQAKWYADSVFFDVQVTPVQVDTLKIIDSLKAYINKYKKGE